jgi:hypothetical protein
MAARRLKRPRDPIQLGRLIVDLATGQIDDRVDDQTLRITPAMAAGSARPSRASDDLRCSVHAKDFDKPRHLLEQIASVIILFGFHEDYQG